MNAKVCKKLRRAARLEPAGKPGRELMLVQQRAFHPDGKKRLAYGLVNNPATVRGVYRRLKREYQAAA